MKLSVTIGLALLLTIAGWKHFSMEHPLMNGDVAKQKEVKTGIPPEEALRIARTDAEKAYRDLTHYRICIILQEDGWHVDYELANPKMQGGGPHYIVNLEGKIIQKRYEQ